MSDFKLVQVGPSTWVLRHKDDVRPEPQRSALPAPRIKSDYIEPVQSMADGKIYDTKSGLSASHKRGGFTEVGNEKMPPRTRPKPDRRQIKETIDKAKARFDRGERSA